MDETILGRFVVAKLDEIIDVVAGMDDETANTVPPLPGGNSAYQLLTHCLGMARQWAMEHADTGRLIGRAGLWNPEGWPGVEVGWMVDSAEWGRGYASEAGRMAVDWAFTTLDLDEVISVTLPHNTASRRVMEKVGLTDTGTTVTLRGHEQVLYRTTRTDWESNASTS